MLIEDRYLRVAGLILAYLAVLEILSWGTASTSPCIIQDAAYKQPQGYQSCPTFTIGMIYLFGVGLDYVGKFVAHAENVTALATVVLAFFTFTLWRSTNRLWSAGEKQRESNERLADRQLRQARLQSLTEASQTRSSLVIARRSAEAAMLGARAAIGIQLPIIKITPDDLSHGDSVVGGEPYEECTVHSVVISNLGATKAFPMEILYGWTVGETLPEKPSYRASDKFLPNFILEPDPKVTPRKTLTLGMPLEAGEWTRICAGNYLWFYCTLLYDDFMETRREAAFCWRWAYIGGGVAWRPDNTPAYNRKGEYPPT